MAAYVLQNLQHIEVEVNVWPTKSGSRQETNFDLLRFCYLFRLRSLRIRACVDPSYFPEFDADDEDLIARRKAVKTIHHLYVRVQRMQSAASKALPKAKVDVGLYIQGKLYETHPHILRFGISWSLARNILRELDDSEDNCVCYRARPTKGTLENSYYGMDLEMDTKEVGFFDVDKYERMVLAALPTKGLVAFAGR